MRLLVPLLALGCTRPPHQDARYDPPDSGEDGLEAIDPAAALGCVRDDGFFGARNVQWSEVDTVATVEWETGAPAASHLVAIGPDGGAHRMPSDTPPGEVHQALLMGLRPDTTYAVVAVAEEEGADTPSCSDPIAMTTGSLPHTLPAFEVQVEPGRAAVGYRVVPIITEHASHLAVFDRDGEAVWAHQVILTEQSSQPIAFRAEVLPDGSGLMYSTSSDGPGLPGTFVRTRWTGEQDPPISIPDAHTDFVLLPGGGIGTLGWDVREVEGRHFLGDTILERSADGSLREVWNVWDHFEPDLDHTYNSAAVDGGPELEDWTHVNSISYVAQEDAYYVTMTEFPAVIRVERSSGQPSWVLSEHTEDFRMMGGALVDMPHSSQRLGDRLLVFNRRSPHSQESCSEATMMTLDEEAGTAVGLWSYQGDRCAQIGFLGNAIEVGAEHALVSWSHLGQLDEIDAEGEQVWKLSVGAGTGFTFVSWAERLR